MRDHIKQRLTVKGYPGEVKKLLRTIRGQKGTSNELLDLESIVPVPEVVKKTRELSEYEDERKGESSDPFSDLGIKQAELEAQCLAETGCYSWNDWVLASWGSESNAYQVSVVEGTMNELIFYTQSWPIFAALRTLSHHFPYVTIHLEYGNHWRSYVGQALFSEDECMSEEYYPHSPLGREIVSRLWGEAEVNDIVLDLTEEQWAN
jgi:hypothetical protein